MSEQEGAQQPAPVELVSLAAPPATQEVDAPENDAHSSGPHNPAEAEVFAAGVLNDFAFGESAGGAAPDAKEYLLKRCRVFDRDVSLVLQNENGPCPLLAIANALVLSGKLSLPLSGPPRVALPELLSLVTGCVLEGSESGDANREQNVSDALALLPSLARGLDVNVRFTAVDAVEFTREVAVFDLLRLPLVHGWLVDPAGDPQMCAAVGSLSYNQLVEALVNEATPADTAALLQRFLDESAAQLTEAGLFALRAMPQQQRVCVFFRNNHFATAYTHGGAFHVLVTDEGYRDQKELIWEELRSVHGDTPFLTAAFQPFEAPPSPAPMDVQQHDGAAHAPAVSEQEAALLRQLQEEEDLATARLLSEQQQPAAQRLGSLSHAAAAMAGAGAEEGFEATSGGSGGGGCLSRELFAAVEAGDADAAMLALAGGQDMNARDVMGRTPLHWAVTSGKEELLELLVGNGARLDVADDSGYTPLHLAAASGQLVMARLLLNRRADPLVSTRGGQMALALASDPQMKHLLQTHPAVLDAQQRSAARVAEAQVSGGGGSQQQGRRVAQRGASEESSGSENTFQRFLSFFK